MSQWITIEAERVLYVHRGRDVILCDRDQSGPVTLVVKVADEQSDRAPQTSEKGRETPAAQSLSAPEREKL